MIFWNIFRKSELIENDLFKSIKIKRKEYKILKNLIELGSDFFAFKLVIFN